MLKCRNPVMLIGLLVLATPGALSGQTDMPRLDRAELEHTLGLREAAYRASPRDDRARRDYAENLFKLGNIWQANDVMAPLARPTSEHPADLRLGARLALLTGGYEHAEALFDRLRAVTPEDGEDHAAALRGLAMVYYQTNRYTKARSLPIPEDAEGYGNSSFLEFMQRFEGDPYQIEWTDAERTAHLPFINDASVPGALPTMRLRINGHPVEFILDTGGDRLYIDEGVAERIGIKHITKRRSRYAYTKGEYVDEPLGVAEAVEMGGVTIRHVPVIVAKWKAMGPTSDGVITTQILKQFLATVDYNEGRLTLRERSERGRRQMLDSLGEVEPYRLPFFMTATHLMFTKGSLDGREGLNVFLDSGLAASMPLVILDETVELLALAKNEIPGTEYYWSPIGSHGIGTLTRGPTQALGNVLVEENSYSRHGFTFDALISHQYLRHLGSWTIDFDTMTYVFPAQLSEDAGSAAGPDR